MIRTLVVGYGKFGRIYTQRAADHPSFQIVGVADPDAKALHAAAQDGRLTSLSAASAIRQCNPDLVIVAASEDAHAQIALEALEQGAHVMLAKPGALSLDDAHDIADRASALDRCVFVDWTPLSMMGWSVAFAEHLQLGPVATARFIRRFSAPPKPCGAVWDLAPHDVAMSWRLSGGEARPRRVVGHQWSTGAYIGITYDAGAVTRIEVDYNSPIRERRVEIACARGTVTWDQEAHIVTVQTPTRNDSYGVIDDPDAITKRLADIANTIGDRTADDANQFVDVIDILEWATEKSTA